MHVEGKGHSTDSHNFHVYTKNARRHNDERLAEVLAEVSSMQWDVIIFSETRSSHDIIELDDGVQSHICFGIGSKTIAAGVAILMHARHKKWAKRNVVLSERVLYVDVQIGKNKIRIIAAYAPHAGYSEQDFANFFEQLHSALHGAYRDGRRVILGGDLNLQIDVGKRGEQFASLCSGFGLLITNDDDHHDPLEDTWTFCSSMGIKRRIDFIASSRSLCLLGSSATNLLDLGSDHRAVRATYFIGNEPKKVPHGVHRMKRGWKPILDACGCPTSYHEMLHAELGHEPKTLLELESMCCRASAMTNKTATERYGQEVVYDDVFHALLVERRRTGSKSQRAQISKSIRKHLRRALREQRNGRIKHVLDEFKDLDRLTHHARAPVYPCPARKDENCPGPDEFANFLENIFASEMGFESPSLKSLVRETKTTGFRETERFTMVELQDALKHLRRNKCADSNGIVAECFVHGSLELHEHLLRIFNSMLVDGHVEERWKQTTFSMIPKTGDPSNPGNWRPLAILNITYKIFTRMVYKRVKPILEAQQSKDQIGFRSSVGVDDAFAVFENVCSKSMEWSVPMWCASLDLRKAFDRIEYNALFDALKVQGVPHAYLKLIASLYHDQVGLVQGRQFPIKRGVKQGDVLSPLLFNAGLEHAMRKWKLRIQHCGLHCGHQTRPLAPPTNNIKGPPKLNLGHGFAKARLANTKQSHTPTPGSLYRCFSQRRTGYKQTSNNNGKTIHGQDTSGKPL